MVFSCELLVCNWGLWVAGPTMAGQLVGLPPYSPLPGSEIPHEGEGFELLISATLAPPASQGPSQAGSRQGLAPTHPQRRTVANSSGARPAQTLKDDEHLPPRGETQMFPDGQQFPFMVSAQQCGGQVGLKSCSQTVEQAKDLVQG